MNDNNIQGKIITRIGDTVVDRSDDISKAVLLSDAKKICVFKKEDSNKCAVNDDYIRLAIDKLNRYRYLEVIEQVNKYKQLLTELGLPTKQIPLAPRSLK